MKEIVYLDINIINSILAQLNGGITTSYAKEAAATNEQSQSIKTQAAKKSDISAQMALGARIARETIEGESSTEKILEGQKDIMNRIFHDYLLDILIDNISDFVKHDFSKEDLHEGDLALTESNFNFYDFELYKKLTDVDLMTELMHFGQSVEDEEAEHQLRKMASKEITNQSKKDKILDARRSLRDLDQGIFGIKSINLVATYFINAFENKAIIQADDILGLINKDYLREMPESIALRSDQQRNAKMLSRVIGVKEHIAEKSDFNKEFSISDLVRIPSLFFDIMLGSFGLIHEGDLLVTPIAIYYE